MCICTHITTSTSQGLSMVDVYTTGRNCCWELLCVSARWQYKSQLFYTGESIVWGGRSLYSMFHYRYNVHTSYNIQKTDVGGGGCLRSIDPVRGFLADFIFLFPPFHFLLSVRMIHHREPTSNVSFLSPQYFFLFCITLERKKKTNKKIEGKKKKKKKPIWNGQQRMTRTGTRSHDQTSALPPSQWL